MKSLVAKNKNRTRMMFIKHYAPNRCLLVHKGVQRMEVIVKRKKSQGGGGGGGGGGQGRWVDENNEVKLL